MNEIMFKCLLSLIDVTRYNAKRHHSRFRGDFVLFRITCSFVYELNGLSFEFASSASSRSSIRCGWDKIRLDIATAVSTKVSVTCMGPGFNWKVNGFYVAQRTLVIMVDLILFHKT